MTDYTKRALELIAVASDGNTYRIERRCQALPGDEDGSVYFCCLPDGGQVTWLGDGKYELPDGTIVRVVACSLGR